MNKAKMILTQKRIEQLVHTTIEINHSMEAEVTNFKISVRNALELHNLKFLRMYLKMFRRFDN